MRHELSYICSFVSFTECLSYVELHLSCIEGAFKVTNKRILNLVEEVRVDGNKQPRTSVLVTSIEAPVHIVKQKDFLPKAHLC